jgi:hypothetical protein
VIMNRLDALRDKYKDLCETDGKLMEEELFNHMDFRDQRIEYSKQINQIVEEIEKLICLRSNNYVTKE